MRSFDLLKKARCHGYLCCYRSVGGGMAYFVFLILSFFSVTSFSAVTYTYTTSRAGFTGTGSSAGGAVSSLASQYNGAGLAAPANCGTGATWKMTVLSVTEASFKWNASAGSCADNNISTGITKSQNGSCTSGIRTGNSNGWAGEYCSEGCTIVAETAISANNKVTYYWKTTGGTCSNDSIPETKAPPTDKPSTSCGKGECAAQGTMNGVTYDKCVVCNVVTTDSTKTTSTSSSASSASGATSSSSSSGGESSSTTCNGSSCSTTKTTTKTNADGSSSSETTTSTQDQGGFCKENPDSPFCKGEDASSFGGSCGAFTCDGDAVQCAVARASNQSLCESHVDPTSSYVSVGTSAMSGTLSGSDPRSGGGDSAIGSIDQTNPYAAQCPSDFSFAVVGRSFSIPFSKACPYLELIGYCLVVGSLIGGGRIAFGG